MHIKTKSLLLKSTPPDDPELKQLFQELDILSNLSEKRLHELNMPEEILFRIEKENTLIGEVRFKSIKWFNRKAELSLVIKKEFQNKGYGTEVLKSIIEHAFNTMNLYRLEAEVIDFNDASKSVIEKYGFVLEGRLREAKFVNGKYFDILRYGLLKKEWKK